MLTSFVQTKKPIIITGTGGFIGFHVAHRLLKQGLVYLLNGIKIITNLNRFLTKLSHYKYNRILYKFYM
jgi:nucleoside-diphosphate-sugar epimerase